MDESDQAVGTMEKLRAHQEGRLHRALSVFVFDRAGRLLLQRRAAGKYHSAGLWSNACCSHPRPGEPPAAAAERRLWEEMGIRCPLRPAFTFIYRSQLDGGLVEHELDHVFVGTWEGSPAPDPAEADAWRWVTLAQLDAEIAADPERFTPWLRIILADGALRVRLSPDETEGVESA